jgi:hypothetical protein
VGIGRRQRRRTQQQTQEHGWAVSKKRHKFADPTLQQRPGTRSGHARSIFGKIAWAATRRGTARLLDALIMPAFAASSTRTARKAMRSRARHATLARLMHTTRVDTVAI